MDTDAEFSQKRLPHLEGMSEQQHALIVLINAACYVTDHASKRVLFQKFCECLGLQVEFD